MKQEASAFEVPCPALGGHRTPPPPGRCEGWQMVFPGGSGSKGPACNADQGPSPRSGRSPGEGNDNTLQYFMDRGAWWAIVHGVAKESGMTK